MSKSEAYFYIVSIIDSHDRNYFTEIRGPFFNVEQAALGIYKKDWSSINDEIYESVDGKLVKIPKKEDQK